MAPVSALVLDGLARRATLGIAVEDAERGLTVVVLQKKGAAANAGVKIGDILTGLSGTPIKTTTDYATFMHSVTAGEVVGVALRRAKTHLSVNLRAQPLPLETAAGIDIIYSSVAADGSLRRILIAKPKGNGPFPAILFIGGIGCYTIDNPLLPDTLYRIPAQRLAGSGFVTMRVEKSGVGDSQGVPCPQHDLHNEEHAYVAALRRLKELPYVNSRETYLFGHSIGGILGPSVASREAVAGLILADTTGLTWFEYELINTRRQLALAGYTPDQIDAEMRQKEACMHALLVEMRTPENIVKSNPRCAPELQYPAHYTYMQQVAAFDGPRHWKSIAAPVLVLWGQSDFLTNEEDNRVIVDLVNTYHRGRGTFVAIPHMDHYFEIRASQKASFDAVSAGARGTFDPAIVTTIVDWLRRQMATGG